MFLLTISILVSMIPNTTQMTRCYSSRAWLDVARSKHQKNVTRPVVDADFDLVLPPSECESVAGNVSLLAGDFGGAFNAFGRVLLVVVGDSVAFQIEAALEHAIRRNPHLANRITFLFIRVCMIPRVQSAIHNVYTEPICSALNDTLHGGGRDGWDRVVIVVNAGVWYQPRHCQPCKPPFSRACRPALHRAARAHMTVNERDPQLSKNSRDVSLVAYWLNRKWLGWNCREDFELDIANLGIVLRNILRHGMCSRLISPEIIRVLWRETLPQHIQPDGIWSPRALQGHVLSTPCFRELPLNPDIDWINKVSNPAMQLLNISVIPMFEALRDTGEFHYGQKSKSNTYDCTHHYPSSPAMIHVAGAILHYVASAIIPEAG